MKCPPLTCCCCCCCCFYLLSMSELSLNIHTLHGFEFFASHFIQRRNSATEVFMELNVVGGEMIDPISSRPFPFCSFHLNLDRQRRVHCATRQQKLQFRISLPARFRKTCQSLQQKIYASNSAPSNKMQIKLRPEGHNSDQFIFIIRGIGFALFCPIL